MEVIVSADVLAAYGMDEPTFVKHMNDKIKNTAMESLVIEYVEFTPDRVVMQMEVGPKTRQYVGILHGEASVLLAETAACVAAVLNIDIQKYMAAGLEINSNHLRTKSGGIITAVACLPGCP